MLDTLLGKNLVLPGTVLFVLIVSICFGLETASASVSLRHPCGYEECFKTIIKNFCKHSSGFKFFSFTPGLFKCEKFNIKQKNL